MEKNYICETLKEEITLRKGNLIKSEVLEIKDLLRSRYSIYEESRFKGINLYIKNTTKACDTLAAVIYHPSRSHLLATQMSNLIRSNCDIILHMNNASDEFCEHSRSVCQEVGIYELEEFFLDSDHKYLLHIHSDVIPPINNRISINCMKQIDGDVVSAVVPKIRGCSSYIHYYDESLPPWNNSYSASPHLYLYSLCQRESNPVNCPDGRMLPYYKRFVKIAGTGFGCLLLKRDVVEKAGMSRMDIDYVNSWPDNQWSWKIYTQTDYTMWVDTAVRCRHLCSPLRDNLQLENQPISPNPNFFTEWYGWKMDLWRI